MKIKIFLMMAFCGILLMAGSLVGAQSQDPFANVSYPVKELGNCADKEGCKAYCDNPDKMQSCISFAEKNNLLSSEEIQTAKKMFGLVKGGNTPGGCKSEKSCKAYCDEISHMEECITFGEQNGMIPQEELGDAKKVLAAIKQGIKPPACKGKKECDSYCNESSHMEECISFGIQAGMMPPEETENAKKMLEAIKKGAKPPACRGKTECDIYCQDEAHTQECMDFALSAGLIPEEDRKRMEEGKQQMRKGINNAPAEVLKCLEEKIGLEKLEKIKSGNFSPSKNMGDAMGSCFQIMGGERPSKDELRETGQFAPMPRQRTNEGGASFTGPGGCKTPQECIDFCRSNPPECRSFGPGGSAGDFSMPPGEPIIPQDFKPEQGFQPGQIPEGLVPLPGMMPPPAGNNTVTPVPDAGASPDASQFAPPPSAPPPADAQPIAPPTEPVAPTGLFKAIKNFLAEAALLLGL